jgi:hypothetical protein
VALRDAVGDETGKSGNHRYVLAACSRDDRTSAQVGFRRLDGPCVATPCDGDYGRVLVDRGNRGEASEPGDNLGYGQVGIPGLLAQHRVHPARIVQP